MSSLAPGQEAPLPEPVDGEVRLARLDRLRYVSIAPGRVEFVQLEPHTAFGNWRSDLLAVLDACAEVLEAVPEHLTLVYRAGLTIGGKEDDPSWVFRVLPETRELGWPRPGAPAQFTVSPLHPGHRLVVGFQPAPLPGSVAMEMRNGVSLLGVDRATRLDQAHGNLVAVFQRLLTERLRELIGEEHRDPGPTPSGPPP